MDGSKNDGGDEMSTLLRSNKRMTDPGNKMDVAKNDIDYLDKFPLHHAAMMGHHETVRNIIEERGGQYETDDDGYNPLHMAAKHGKWKVINVLVEKGANVDSKGIKDGFTPLHLAVSNGKMQAVRYLVEAGANVTAKDITNITVLHIAASKGFYESLTYLLSLDGIAKNINVTDKKKRTPLHHAVASGDFETTKLLLDFDADVSRTDNEGHTALDIAARDNHPDLIEVLIQSGGCSIQQKRKSSENEGKNNFNPLEIACMNGNFECAKILKEKGNFKTAISNNKSKMTINLAIMFPLHRACGSGDINVVMYFIERNACVDTKADNGYTPLMIAVRNSHDEIVQYLLNNGANMHLRDWNYKTCLHIAVEQKDISILHILLNHSDKYILNCGDKDHRTPLHYAAEDGNKLALEALLQGASYMVTDHKGISPLHLAAEHGSLECVQLLIAFSKRFGFAAEDVINQRAKDAEQSTPISLAAKGCHSTICSYLIEMGGKIEHMESADTVIFVETFENMMSSDSWSPSHLGDKKPVFVDVMAEIQCLRCLVEHGEHEGDGITPISTPSPKSPKLKQQFRVDPDEFKWKSNSIRCLRREVREIFKDGNKDRPNRLVEMLKKDISDKYGESDDVYMGKLIKYTPLVAEYALDKSIENVDESKRIYNFELLDIPHNPPPTPLKEPFFAPDTMNRYARELLSHSVTKRLLESKWERLCFGIFVLGFIAYIVFLCLITSVVIIDKGRGNISVNGTTDVVKSSYPHVIMSWLTLALCIILIIKEFMRMRYMKLLYVQEPSNCFELVTYIATLVFMVPFIVEVGIIQNNEIASLHRFKWQAGAFAMLCAWATLLLYLKWIPSIGIYVWMFEEVVKTVIKVILGLMCLLIAFAFTIYVLFSEKANFKNYGRVFMIVTVWSFGEFQFNDTFVESPIKYPELTYIVFFIFLIIMPILTMNLLVGLAVGDIDAVRITAFDRNLTNQIKALDNFNETYPKWILRKLYKKDEKDDPKSISFRERVRDLSNDLDDDDEVDDPFSRRLSSYDVKAINRSDETNGLKAPIFQPVLATLER